jgi:2,2-dialkylglycine decarboxylase (pyruvate)
MVVEPVLSAGGVIPLPDGYLQAAKQKCEERDMLLIVDEAQTGFGRTGAMFAFEHDNVVPDILTVSKTLGGGIPLGATITSEEIAETAVENGFLHITTHVSDPMPAAAGLAVLDVITDEDLVQRTQKMGVCLTEQLRALQTEFPQIGDVRGRGLLVGLELVEDLETKQPANDLGGAVTEECLRLGLSMNIVKGDGSQRNCLRLAPPLTITAEEVDIAIDILKTALRTCL